MSTFTIAIDAMGGDYGPSVTVPASLNSLKQFPHLKLIFVGDEAKITTSLKDSGWNLENERVQIRHASQCVEMHESPSKALRNKKDSSMRVAINLVKEGAADACVSAGNTGALMATARFVLKLIPGLDRPAIISTLPSMKGHTYMLDLGANVDSKAEHLFHFALMGNEMVKAVEHIKEPKVGLLNIGEEEMKGNEQVKKAAQLLTDSDLNYIGFVEGTDIFLGDVDIVVADGFVGNIALKTTEGLAEMIGSRLKRSFTSSLYGKIVGLLAKPVLKIFKEEIDPREYNGASFLGLKGIVVKSHGGADTLAFQNAVEIAYLEIEENVAEKINAEVERLLNKAGVK
ncbi:MAG: phosphate acyltransferase PlsX [Gammaproteobacteria bacterium]|nr:MAG: phosphate acyltransferase PlsX [Gammaproteobacteria bacterium]RLA21494.1 MAG: phosphate acyltransferase PlsX [Gammaproteobacteria bacterium]